MKNQNAIILFARTPAIKRSAADEPFAALPWDDLDAIFHACLGDIISRAAEIPDADVLLYRKESYLPVTKLSQPRDNLRIFDMQEGPFAQVVGQAVENAFLENYHRVVVILENNPAFGTAQISRAIDLLGTDDESVVVTPSGDGHAAMLALRSNHPSIFRPGDPVLKPDGILSQLCDLEVYVHPTAPVFLVDTPGRIDLLRRTLAAMDPAEPGFPKQTSGIFRSLEKKYRLKKVGV